MVASSTKQRYDRLVSEFVQLGKRDVDGRLRMGEIIHEALELGVTLLQISGDTNVTTHTLSGYRESWLFWGDDRVPGNWSWGLYKRTAMLATAFPRKAKSLKAAVLKEGFNVLADWRRELESRTPVVDRAEQNANLLDWYVASAARTMEEILDQEVDLDAEALAVLSKNLTVISNAIRQMKRRVNA